MRKRSLEGSEKLLYRERLKFKVANNAGKVKVKPVKTEDNEVEDLELKATLIQQLIPIGLMALKELLESEVNRLVGARYSRGKACNRWGRNPGWVYMGDQKVSVAVPRVRRKNGGEEIQLNNYQKMQDSRQIDDLTLKRVVSGLSQRKYGKAVIAIPETFGIKSSSVSRRFVRASSKQLRLFMERDLSRHDIVTIIMDGKSFGRNQFVIAMGITMEGEKILLGFIEAGTENNRICRDFLRNLIDRGLRTDNEILFIIDGAKGLRKGISEVFEDKAFVQRCQWHKRENVISYLGKDDQEEYRRKMQAAYEQPSYQKAKSRLMSIHRELKKINISAASSLMGGWKKPLPSIDSMFLPNLE